MPVDATLAQSHPAEVWGALIAMGGGLITLVGVLYNRINKDVDETYDDHVQLRDDVDAEVGILHRRIEHHKELCDTKNDQLLKDLGLISNSLTRTAEQIAQFATSSTFTNEELDRLATDIKDLNKRLMTIEVEHKHCLRLHQNLLGGDNAHH